jgi:hypothetical protein
MLTFISAEEVTCLFADEDMEQVRAWAAARRTSAREKKRAQAYFIEGTKWDSLDTEVQSMMAEYAVACYLGQPDWIPVHKPDRNEGDVAINGIPVEVKSTERKRGCLPIKEDEKRSRPYVLAIVNVNAKTVKLAGWIMAPNGKRKEWWRADVRFPAYFVPQHALLSVEMLKEIVEGSERSAERLRG